MDRTINLSGPEDIMYNGKLVLALQILLFIAFTALCEHNAVPPVEGNGSYANPYRIENLSNLRWLSEDSTLWKYHFVQVTDINAAETRYWNDGAGFSPIGNENVQFTGSYNGKGHRIDSLFINRSDLENVGLFGNVNGVSDSSRIDSLGVTNAEISGKTYVGVLAGGVAGFTISISYSSGKVSGEEYVGGLIGDFASGKVEECFSSCHVLASVWEAGGLIGHNYDSNIFNCYSNGIVEGGKKIGGLIGLNINCTLGDCYSVSRVSGDSGIGGLVGLNKFTVTYSCFWDMEICGDLSADVTGKSTAQMKSLQTYIDAGWNFMKERINGTGGVWGINSVVNDGYPFLAWQGYEMEYASIFNNQGKMASDALGTAPLIRTFAGSNRITFSRLPVDQHIRLRVFTVSGRKVIEVIKKVHKGTVELNINCLSHGSYIVELYCDKVFKPSVKTIYVSR
jgi:hypothetical protein